MRTDSNVTGSRRQERFQRVRRGSAALFLSALLIPCVPGADGTASNLGLISANPSVCVTFGPVLHFLAPGGCLINAFGRLSQTIQFDPLTSQTLDAPPLAPGARSSSGLPVTLSSETPLVCAVFGASVFPATTGPCIVTASQKGNANYLAAPAVTRTFSVLAARPCTYVLNPAQGSVAASGGTFSFALATSPACAWTASSNSPFITLTSGFDGTGTDTPAYSVAPNPTGNLRTGTITAGGQIHSVTQFSSGCSFTLGTQAIDLPAAGGTSTVSVVAASPACAWSGFPSEANNPTISPPGGSGSQQVTLTVAANLTNSVRNLSAIIGSQSISIRQNGANCNVTLSGSGFTVDAAGGQGSVGVTLPAGCVYTAANVPSWVSILWGGSGGGPGGTVFFLTVPNSTQSDRSVAMNIGGQIFLIQQSGVSCEVSMDTSALNTSLDAAGANGVIGISASRQTCSWTATSNASWLTIAPPGSTAGNGSLAFLAAPNDTTTRRLARININSQAVNIYQAGSVCAYALRSPGAAAPASGGNGLVSVFTDSACSWTASSNASWLTVPGETNRGSKEVQFAAATNSTGASRSALLTLGGQVISVNQTAVGCLFTLSALSGSSIASGASGLVQFSTVGSGCIANAVSAAGWLTVTTTFGGQSGSFSWSAANNFGAARTGLVRLGDQTFTVNQAAAPCSFTLGAPGATFGLAGGPGTILATASTPGCTPAVSGTGFVGVGALSGPAGGVYRQAFIVPPFSSIAGAVRSAQINISGRTFLIKQTSW